MLRGRRHLALSLALTTVAALFIALSLQGSPSYATATFFDDLHRTTLNPDVWNVQVVGGDVGVASPQPDGLHLTLVRKGSTWNFGVVVFFTPTVSGDFDASVGYRLLTWPPQNGGRTHLSSISIGNVERVSFNSNDVGFPPGEQYVTDFSPVGQSPTGFTATSDTQGRLRLTRVGNTYAGYRWDGMGWTLINAYTGSPTGPLTKDLCLVLHSTTYAWAGQTLEVAFENFTLTADSISITYHVFLPQIIRQ